MRQTVFKSQEQTLELKELFFNGFGEDRKRALELCRAYESRHHLPVAVHLTALLTAAILADVPMNDVYAIRLGYSAALIRMVNEVLDSAQTGKVAAPLHALAKMLDLPNTFVEARHAATHENLPSISVLRELSNRALGWLHDKFWVLQVPPKRKEKETDTKQTFSSWRRSRRSHVNAPLTTEEKELVGTLLEQYKSDKNGFMKVLFDRNILIPSDLSLGDYSRKADKVITLWGPALAEMGNAFLIKLALGLSEALDKNDWDATSMLSDKSQVLITWLEFVVDHLESPSELVLKQLGSRPRPWNAKGLAAYYRRFQVAEVCEKASKMARFTRIDVDLPDPVTENSESKWKVVKRWTPRPIGS